MLLLLLSCSQFRQLSRADAQTPDEKLDYLVLASFTPAAAQQYVSLPSGEQKSDYYEWFWKARAPADSALPDRATVERRARQARDYFGAVDLLNDDRVRTYIRYGPPRREQYEPKPVENESLRIVVNPAELWYYDSLGLQLDFVKTGTAFKRVGRALYGPAAVMPAFEGVDLGGPAPTPTPDAAPLGLQVALGRLGQRGDSAEVELQYGVPLSDLERALGSGRQVPLYIHIEFQPATPAHGVTRELWVAPVLTPETAFARMVVGRETFLLPADIYDVTVWAVARDGRAASRCSQSLDLVDYVRHAQPCSDMLFYSLVDSTFQSGQFMRPDWSRAVPLVVPRVRSGETFYALYEVYNLATDSAGEHRAEAVYELMERDTRRLAVIPSPSRFISGSGTTGVAVERVHTMDLVPGHYLLISRVRDLDDNHTASLTAEFQILPAH